MDEKVTKRFLDLLRSACTGATPEEVTLSNAQEKQLCQIAKAHDLGHIVYAALQKEGRGIEDPEVAEKLKKQYDIALFRHLRRQMTLEKIRNLFEDEKIVFLPLKGVILMDLYPEPWMRSSSDIDVLVGKDDYDRAALALENAGFVPFGKTGHDRSFRSPDRTHVELHFSLIEEYRFPKVDAVLESVWEHTAPIADGSAERRLDDETFYFYHIAHMMKHFESGGCGVRPFIDLWYLMRCAGADAKKRKAALERGGMTAFANACEALSEAWFSGSGQEGVPAYMEEYVLTGGVYGTMEQAVSARRRKSGKRGPAYYFSRLFPSGKEMRGRYPVLQKKPLLLPFYYGKRLLGLLSGKTRSRAKAEIQAEKASQTQKDDRIGRLLQQLEI